MTTIPYLEKSVNIPSGYASFLLIPLRLWRTHIFLTQNLDIEARRDQRNEKNGINNLKIWRSTRKEVKKGEKGWTER